VLCRPAQLNSGRGTHSKARKRLAAAQKRGKGIYGSVRLQTVEGAQGIDTAVREHPYQAIGIALGVWTLLGHPVARRWRGATPAMAFTRSGDGLRPRSRGSLEATKELNNLPMQFPLVRQRLAHRKCPFCWGIEGRQE